MISTGKLDIDTAWRVTWKFILKLLLLQPTKNNDVMFETNRSTRIGTSNRPRVPRPDSKNASYFRHILSVEV